jgi:lipopolysaccharide/colanic/teichoic acid biosynthesis glycosyltransferase
MGHEVVSRSTALVLLLAALPAMVVLGTIIVLFGRKPIFRQSRIGLNGVPFAILKFRTMDDAGSGRRLGPRSDAAFARFARVLRHTRLDELPQLCNILLGQMGFVGPRPLTAADLAQMGHAGRERQSVKPGLTGLAQINGGTVLSQREKLAYDLAYIAHRSPAYDARILMLTAVRLLQGVDTLPGPGPGWRGPSGRSLRP